jgi:hypothetical protein
MLQLRAVGPVAQVPIAQRIAEQSNDAVPDVSVGSGDVHAINSPLETFVISPAATDQLRLCDRTDTH